MKNIHNIYIIILVISNLKNMSYEDKIFKCGYKECIILSAIIGIIVLFFVLMLNIYLYRNILNQAKQRYNIENDIVK